MQLSANWSDTPIIPNMFLDNSFIKLGLANFKLVTDAICYVQEQTTNIINLPMWDNKYAVWKATTDFAETNSTFLDSFADYLEEIDPEGKTSDVYVKNIRARTEATRAFSLKDQIPEWNLQVEPTEILKKDFCKVLRFDSLSEKPNPPKVFLVPPISWHYSTLLRPTVKELINENITYVMDHMNAKHVDKNIKFCLLCS